jgi:outer membrane protein
VLQEQLQAARERFEVGEVTRTDVEQARARVAASQSNLAASRGQLRISREAFTRVVGRPPEDLDPLPPMPDLPQSLEEGVRIALQNQPNIEASRLERIASGSDVRAAIGALLPQLSVQGTISQLDTLEDEFEGNQSASVGLALTIPFYRGGANYSGVRQAQAQVEAAEADITSAIRDTIETVGTAWAQLEVARASIEAGRLEVRAAELAFEGITEEAKVGARTTIDVLDAEQDVLNAKADLVTAQRDEYVSAYNILAAMGLVTVEHLGLELDEDPTVSAYYEAVRDRNFGYDESDDTVWSLSWRP